MGVILVTQRTANVTKTILNQCHTIFALRSFDATGLDFLRSYMGGSYAATLPTLEERTAVLFGRASSCPGPVIIRINDRNTLLAEFWNDVSTTLPLPMKEIEAQKLGILGGGNEERSAVTDVDDGTLVS
jgi:hypothetical protein